jgi:23S rRNA (pseudouridine1915-N3)-methyltransferase
MITILAVGKIKEQYIRQTLDDYIGRIGRFDRVAVREIPEGPSSSPLRSEAEGLLRAIPKGAYIFAADRGGRTYDSVDFAGRIGALYASSRSNLCFIVGGSEGLDASVLSRADETVSFSAMTFPHQLFRLILAEQLYRAMKIIRGQTYHK